HPQPEGVGNGIATARADSTLHRDPLSERRHVPEPSASPQGRHPALYCALPDHYGRMDTHPKHRRMETTPGTRAGQTPHPLPFPRLPLIRRGARIGLAASALAILAACAGTGPEGL